MNNKMNKLLIGKILGILSIVVAIIFPFLSGGLGGIVLGTIGLIELKDEKKETAKKFRILNIIGIVLGGINLILVILYGGMLNLFPSI